MSLDLFQVSFPKPSHKIQTKCASSRERVRVCLEFQLSTVAACLRTQEATPAELAAAECESEDGTGAAARKGLEMADRAEMRG